MHLTIADINQNSIIKIKCSMNKIARRIECLWKENDCDVFWRIIWLIVRKKRNSNECKELLHLLTKENRMKKNGNSAKHFDVFNVKCIRLIEIFDGIYMPFKSIRNEWKNELTITVFFLCFCDWDKILCTLTLVLTESIWNSHECISCGGFLIRWMKRAHVKIHKHYWCGTPMSSGCLCSETKWNVIDNISFSLLLLMIWNDGYLCNSITNLGVRKSKRKSASQTTSDFDLKNFFFPNSELLRNSELS